MAVRRTVKVDLKGDISDYNRAMLSAAATTRALGKEIDSSNDRTAWLVQSALALGPALVSVGAAGVPVIAGLANQLGLAAAGAGAAVLAFMGVGDALKALNAYELDPTTANFNKLAEAMAKLSPAGRDFARFLQEIRPELQGLQDAAQMGLFPGLESGIRTLMTQLPQAERIIFNLTDTLGGLTEEAAQALTGPEWSDFFDMIERQSKTTLVELGRTFGNLTQGLAELWMAFEPLERDFSKGFLNMSRDFNDWAANLDQTQGFQEFLDYVERIGPKVWSTLGAISHAILEIFEAAAPVGEASLPILKALSDAISAIAETPLGPTVIAIAALASAIGRLRAVGALASGGVFGNILNVKGIKANLPTMREFGTATYRMGQSARYASLETLAARDSVRGFASAAAPAAAAAGVFALSASGMSEKLGLTNTVLGAMIGSTIPGFGTAIGAGVGALLDLKAASSEGERSLAEFQNTLAGMSFEEQGEALRQAREMYDATFGGTWFEDGDFDKGLKELEEKHRAAAEKARDQELAESGLADALRFASDETRDQTYALLENIRAKNEAADAANAVFSAETAYRRALKAAQEQAKSNKAGIDGMSDAALKNRESLERLAGAWNRQAEAGGVTEKQMKAAKDEFVRVAESMGVSAEQAHKLADELFKIPTKRNVKVDVDISKAYTQIDKLKEYLKGIKDEEVIVNVRRAIESGGGRGHQTVNSASGGFITGPGTATSDSIPAWLSNGEYVIKASSVAKYGVGFLDHINAGRFAEGGYATATRASSAAHVTQPVGADGLVASIEGARFRIDTDGFMTAVRGEIRVGLASAGRSTATARRREGR